MNGNEANPENVEIHWTASDHFSWLRTRLSIERTLMSSLRTASALIGFGFTIVQVFERLQSQASTKPVLVPEAPRDLGLALIGAGVLSIVFALRQYRALVNYLWCMEFRAIAGISETPYRTPLSAMSMLLAFVGVAAFVTVLFRLS